jgi:C4-type Zn-finger protein
VDGEFSGRMKIFLNDLLSMKNGEKPFTITLIDPISSSFLQNPYHPQEDKKAKRVTRPRNEEEDDFLGFEGMNVDNYK